MRVNLSDGSLDDNNFCLFIENGKYSEISRCVDLAADPD